MWDVLGLRFLAPPAVTSASEVLTQTYCSSGLFQFVACWAQNNKVCEEQSFTSVCRIVRQCRTWTCPFSESGGILRGDPVDPTRAHFRAHCCIICRCFSSSDSRTYCGIVLVLSGADSAAHWRQIVEFPNPWRLSRTTGGGRNRGRDSLRIGGWLLAPEIDSVEVEKFPRASSSSAGRPRQVVADRARAGEKFFDGPLSGQSVYEQTSGVLRHTESVRDDKVQEQDWRQALEQKSRAPQDQASEIESHAM